MGINSNSPDWQTEAALAPSIEFRGPLSAHAWAPERVFVTGTTGFLGAFLLAELLQQTRAACYCLVRAEDPDSAMVRLRTNLQQLGLWSADFAPRIIPVSGDLTLPRLGLSPPEFEELAGQLDAIFHSGAAVDFIRPYAALRAANVLGTQEILRLAGAVRTKPVHFTSSLALFFSREARPHRTVSEHESPTLDLAASSGYAQSKWVAEQLILAARERGLPATIYRTARITGHSQTGATCNWNDLLNGFLKGCIVLGAYPSLPGELAMVPVDYISRAVVHLAWQPQSAGRAFHFFQPRPISLVGLVELLRGAGYALSELEPGAWRAELKRLVASAHPERQALARLGMLLSAPHHLFDKKPSYEAPNLQEGLRGTSIACPPIDRALIATYLAFFQQRGFIAAPPGAAPDRGTPE